MPDTQKGWILNTLVANGWSRGLTGKQVASLLAAAWPSSPQGLAVKQMVEVLGEAHEALTDRTGDYLAVMDVVAERIEEVQEAARKAGL